MKRSQQSVSAAETGRVPGDYSGKRSGAWKNKGGRNATTDEARRGAGQLAPRPQNSSQALLGSSSATAPVQASHARVKAGGKAPQGGSHLPVQNNAMRGLIGPKVGQPNPDTSAAASSKPKRKGLGASFYGEY